MPIDSEQKNLEIKNSVEGFLDSMVLDRDLDERTVKAYRLDLELFFQWIERRRDWGVKPENEDGQITGCCEKKAEELVPLYGNVGGRSDGLSELEDKWEESIGEYLEYLLRKKGLRFSTVLRKYRVFSHYLPYLKSQGMIRRFSAYKASRPARADL